LSSLSAFVFHDFEKTIRTGNSCFSSWRGEKDGVSRERNAKLENAGAPQASKCLHLAIERV
jgi:hypothetical protein